MRKEMQDKFDLSGRRCLITGAGGFLGPQHARAILDCNGLPILTDWHEDRVNIKAKELEQEYELEEGSILTYKMDVTNKNEIDSVVDEVYSRGLQINILVNNAAKNPKVSKDSASMTPEARFEVMTEEYFDSAINSTVKGTFLVTQAVANKMLTHEDKSSNVILNIASDLAVIAPDQRIYRDENLTEEQQNVKPVTYSMGKYSLIGLTSYLSVYFAGKIRVNALSPTGVWNSDIPKDFEKKLTNLIPMGRMSYEDEYKATVAYMCSKASSYMTGHNLICDGGKTVW